MYFKYRNRKFQNQKQGVSNLDVIVKQPLIQTDNI